MRDNAAGVTDWTGREGMRKGQLTLEFFIFPSKAQAIEKYVTDRRR